MASIRMMFVSTAAGLVLLISSALHAQPTGVTGYELISLGVAPGRTTSSAIGVDDLGRVVGSSGSPFSTPFVWINGEMVVLPSPPDYQDAQLSDIGRGGVIVGRATRSDSITVFHPVAWTATQGIHMLGRPPGMERGNAKCADDRPWPHTLIGGYTTTWSNDTATLWRGTSPTLIDEPISTIGDVNNYGHAVGGKMNPQGVFRPMLWRDGRAIDIGGEPTNVSGGAGSINEHGEIVGGMTDARLACHWYNGVRTDLPEVYPCGYALRKAWAINDSGLIVGTAPDANCATLKAAIWDRKQGFRGYIINDYMPRHPEVDLLLARDINDAGQVAAYGEPAPWQGRGYLVTPYLFEMSDPVPGRAGTVNTITVTGLQPNQRVHLVWGTQEGAQKIRPACPGGTLLIRDPQALQAVRADQSGVATITINVPLIARGRTVRLQAVAPIECQISHTVTWTFE